MSPLTMLTHLVVIRGPIVFVYVSLRFNKVPSVEATGVDIEDETHGDKCVCCLMPLTIYYSLLSPFFLGKLPGLTLT